MQRQRRITRRLSPVFYFLLLLLFFFSFSSRAKLSAAVPSCAPLAHSCNYARRATSSQRWNLFQETISPADAVDRGEEHSSRSACVPRKSMTAAKRRVSRFVFDRRSFSSSPDSTQTEGTTRVSLMGLNYRRVPPRMCR